MVQGHLRPPLHHKRFMRAKDGMERNLPRLFGSLHSQCLGQNHIQVHAIQDQFNVANTRGHQVNRSLASRVTWRLGGLHHKLRLEGVTPGLRPCHTVLT